MSRDDFELMAAIAARDRGALAAFYDRHSPTVFGLCLRVLRDRGEAEEVLGDIFLEVWNRAERYEASRGTPVAYLMNLGRSRALDRLRAGVRRNRHLAEKPFEDGSTQSTEAGPSHSDPLASVLDGERRVRVARALEALSPVQRQALELAYYEGLSQSEVAEALGEPLGTVKSRIRQGMRELRESLRPLYGRGATP